MTVKKLLVHSVLMTKSVAQYCYADLHAPIRDRDKHGKDSNTEGLGHLSTTAEDIAWIV